MTELLQLAIAEIEKLPGDAQDAIALRILDELADERAWNERFAAATDEHWNRLAAEIRRNIAAKETTPLEDMLSRGAPGA